MVVGDVVWRNWDGLENEWENEKGIDELGCEGEWE